MGHNCWIWNPLVAWEVLLLEMCCSNTLRTLCSPLTRWRVIQWPLTHLTSSLFSSTKIPRFGLFSEAMTPIYHISNYAISNCRNFIPIEFAPSTPLESFLQIALWSIPTQIRQDKIRWDTPFQAIDTCVNTTLSNWLHTALTHAAFSRHFLILRVWSPVPPPCP